MVDMDLSERDKQTLDFESRRWKYAGAKESAIRELFDETPTRFYQRLHELLRNPEAAQYAPLTVHRLLRLETARRAARTSKPRETVPSSESPTYRWCREHSDDPRGGRNGRRSARAGRAGRRHHSTRSDRRSVRQGRALQGPLGRTHGRSLGRRDARPHHHHDDRAV